MVPGSGPQGRANRLQAEDEHQRFVDGPQLAGIQSAR
jgi:hypothetical protein